jgi:hypothetical protein
MGFRKNRFCQKEEEAVKETQINEEKCKNQIDHEGVQPGKNFPGYTLGIGNRYRRCDKKCMAVPIEFLFACPSTLVHQFFG